MKIIIVGDGKVGYNLASQFSKEDHDIVIIDKNVDALQKASDFLDVMCIKGNGLSTSVLMEAGCKEADLVIAATSRDEINMLSCLTAKKLGAVHTIARIRDPEYARELTILIEEMELDMVINPEYETAAEIARIIKFPSVSSVDTFAHGRVELVSFRISEADPITGLSLAQITAQYKSQTIFCAIEREEQVYIPDGSFVIHAGDSAYIIGETKGILNFFRQIKRTMVKTKTATLVGGSRIAHYLSVMLLEAGIKVRIIEANEAKCFELSETLPNCTIIHGDGVDEEVLKNSGIEETDAFITLTNIDEENLFAAIYAKHIKVPKVIAKSNRTNYNNLFRKLGVDSIVSPKDTTSDQILRYVRALANTIHSEFETLYKIVNGQAEALCFTAGQSTRFLNTELKDLNFKKELLVAAIIRGRKIIIPKGNDVICENDQVIVVTKQYTFYNLNQIVEDAL